MSIQCDTCHAVSPLENSFAEVRQSDVHYCPNCQQIRIARWGRLLWLLGLSSLIGAHHLLNQGLQTLSLSLFTIITWLVVMVFAATVVFELLRFFIAKTIGAQCPLVSVGHGASLFSFKLGQTRWQFCAFPSVSAPFCYLPKSKASKGRQISLLLLPGLISLSLSAAAFTLFFLTYTKGAAELQDLIWAIAGLANAYVGILALVPRQHSFSNGGLLLQTVVDPTAIYRQSNWGYQSAVAQELVRQEKPQQVYQLLSDSESFDESARHCYLIANAAMQTFEFEAMQSWFDRSLEILEYEMDESLASEELYYTVQALACAGRAFGLYLANAEDSEDQQNLSEFAFEYLPWDFSVMRAQAQTLVQKAQAADAEAALALLKRSEKYCAKQGKLARAFACLVKLQAYHQLEEEKPFFIALNQLRRLAPSLVDRVADLEKHFSSKQQSQSQAASEDTAAPIKAVETIKEAVNDDGDDATVQTIPKNNNVEKFRVPADSRMRNKPKKKRLKR